MPKSLTRSRSWPLSFFLASAKMVSLMAEHPANKRKAKLKTAAYIGFV
jgi:hypothetical protein